ncbi:hypothetical protein E4U35_000533 [Claviceps purpurea]|nr:hypothetical protein E4U38_003183 [Claviceps purpurea]KAG6144503.1 hypothetical protein E4U12_004797 [Claviceps purpurea]KAG6154582.1 hypothetical protein E4U37_001904 [Claviceps purpurea]KAG6164770.1 hypothetical protein E4U11_000913 [Claviceps purpurea]KAG6197135.1 hypothetical protein E4U10_000275 [Claviceps purpurea]
MRTIQLLASLLAFPSIIAADGVENARRAAAASFDWNSITPSKTLEYHGCYDSTVQCARLILPLDYKNLNDTRNVVIAILKRPASVPDTHATFGGSIFLNPGGPGGSATDMIRQLGPAIQQRIEHSGRRHYEYIGMDPRGVGFSWPPANCFPGDLFSRQTYNTETKGLGALNEGARTIPYGLAMQQGFGQHCLKADSTGANGGPVFSYAGTASVARDMVEVADQIEKLRQNEANKSSSATARNSTSQDVVRVQYLGFSYGTVLGHFLMSLFPERVGRIVLDGVVDARDYSSGPGWTTNLVDTDKIYTQFFTGCHQNPSTCALSRPNDSSANDIRHRFEIWLNTTLRNKPAVDIGPTGDIRVLSADDVRVYMASTFYHPLALFQDLASRLDKAMNGNASALIERYFPSVTAPHSKEGCVLPNDQVVGPSDGDSTFAVACGDGDDVTGKDVAWWQRYTQRLVSQSSILGPQWSAVRFRCSSWPFKSNWRFKGPFTAPAPKSDANGNPVPGYPAAPILYASSRLDPVTPLTNARAMQANYPGSGLVIVEGAGHTAVDAAGENRCLFDAVEKYLETGIVPSNTTVCQLDCGPWAKSCPGPWTLRKRAVSSPSDPKLSLPRFPLGLTWA